MVVNLSLRYNEMLASYMLKKGITSPETAVELTDTFLAGSKLNRGCFFGRNTYLEKYFISLDSQKYYLDFDKYRAQNRKNFTAGLILMAAVLALLALIVIAF